MRVRTSSIFSGVVGPKGHVFAFVPAEFVGFRATAADKVKAIAALPAYANVTVVTVPFAETAAPEDEPPGICPSLRFQAPLGVP